MASFPLIQGSYLARGVIANAQSCVNLFPEPNTKDAPFPMSHYPTSGTSVFCDYTGQLSGYVRGLYTASDGALFAVVGNTAIRVVASGNNEYVVMGTISSSTGPVSMCDNQTTLVIVDGSPNGWWVDLTNSGNTGSLAQINDPAFYGSNRVDYIDTFLVFNKPGTPQFYTTTSNALTPFNPLYFANKEGWNDYLMTIAVLHDNIWLLGVQTTEVWFNSGAPDFPFQRMPNTVLQQGCVAPYSPVIADNAIYWLSQDRWGRNLMMRGEGYMARRVSNFAIENEWANYGTVGDCVGMVYQQAGHEIAGFLFPSANAWWGYDATTGQWHRRAYGDTTTAWLPYCMAFWGTFEQGAELSVALAGDRTAPRILQISRNNYTDCGTPIVRQRAWPHAVNDGNRQHYSRFSLSMNGNKMVLGNAYPDEVDLDWSDDGGFTFGNPVPQTVNQQSNGQYQWRRLGYGRDRVFRVTWTAQGETALQGAWVDAVPMGT